MIDASQRERLLCLGLTAVVDLFEKLDTWARDERIDGVLLDVEVALLDAWTDRTPDEWLELIARGR